MRLFIAITPSEVALSEIETMVSPLRATRPDLRWASQQSWHITLAFLGEVNDKVANRLPARLKLTAAKHYGLDLKAASGGAFPAPSKARVLWTGIECDQKALKDIADSVAARARRAGAPSPDEKRSFRPHITLARCKEPVDLRSLVDELRGFSGSVWAADRIHLIRSYLGPQPHYESIGSWPLKPVASQ